MGKRWIILLLLACGVLVAGAILVLTTSKEPSYNGRRLGFWVVVYANDFQMRANQGRDPFLGTGTESEYAIRRMGTNAIPWLLKWIRYEQPRRNAGLLRWVNRWLPRAGVRQPIRDNQHLRATGAMRAFVALGSQGKSALPELSRLLNSPGRVPGASKAGPALAGMGADALPAFLSALANPAPDIRANAAFNLQYLGTNALPATPQLLSALTDSDLMVTWAAAQTLGMLKAEPLLVVPRLQALLSDPDPKRRTYGAQGLMHYGSWATSAVPALLTAMKSTNQDVQFFGRRAVLTIDPKALSDPALR